MFHKFISAFFLGWAILLSFPAQALNGAQLTGIGAVNESLGGSGVAFPQDFSAILVNPAGISEIEKIAGFNLTWAWPHSQTNSSAAFLGNAAAGLMKSRDDLIILPGGGFVMPISDDFHFGFLLSPVAGFSLDFPASRLSPTFTGNAYDSNTYYGLLKIVPALSYKINDQWSVAIALHLDHADFNTDSANVGIPFPEVAGKNHRDGTLGFGLGMGILYQPFSFLSAGLSYTTEQWMKDFEKYTDLLPRGLNFPQQISAGLTWKLPQEIFINTDFRWINWSGATGAFGDSVSSGGLGWQDQYIALLGVQYEPFDWMKLRMGYNYGRSAVPSGSLFASELAGPITEHHLSVGAGFKIKKIKIDFSYVRSFGNTVTDDGSQNAGAGAGAFSTQSIDQLSTQIGLIF